MAIMDDVKIINALIERLRSLEDRGFTSKANYADRLRVEEFQTDRFVKLYAVKRGAEELVEFSRIVSFEKVRRVGVGAIADSFCSQAADALAKIDVE
jgi:hypothetical protein